MRLLGLDVGSKTIGVAVSDPLGITAQPVATIEIDEDRHNFGMRSLKKLVREYEPDGFVLGLPKKMDGSDGASVERSQAMADRLKQKFDLPVYFDDERLTTVESERILIEQAGVHDRRQRKKVVDHFAELFRFTPKGLTSWHLKLTLRTRTDN